MSTRSASLTIPGGQNRYAMTYGRAWSNGGGKQNRDRVYSQQKNGFRQEKRVQELLDQRGDGPGLVCILSAMEPCGSHKPWHDKKTHQTYLKPADGKCLHYDVYFIDRIWGCAPYACPRGVRSGCRSTAMDTVI